MFGWIFKKEVKEIEEETRKGFSDVKRDMDSVGKWIKHLDKQDKHLSDVIFSIKIELSSLHDEVESLREATELISESEKNKQVFKKLPVFEKQTADEDVQKAVQTAVQTDNIYDILKSLSGNERVIVMALMNNDMKLSYEDLALLLGKEKSTIRGQINMIKQKNDNLIEEIVEKNGKKRVYIPEEIKGKLSKYAKVRGGKERKKDEENRENEEKEEENEENDEK